MDASGERELVGERDEERDASADAEDAAVRDAVGDFEPATETLALVESDGEKAAERVGSGLADPLTVRVVLMVDDAVPEIVATAGLRLGLEERLT